MCGKEGDANVNMSNMVVKGIAKNQNVVMVSKAESVFMW
jgi:hypothetical protein